MTTRFPAVVHAPSAQRRLPHLIHRALIPLTLLGLAPLAAAQNTNVATQPAPPTSTVSSSSSVSTRPQAVTLGEVVVTANRRREPSREVPMHVDTVAAESLQQVGAKTLNDYVSYQPGVFFASSGGAGEGELVMRGVSTGNQTSPTVSVYIDDVPVGGTTVYAAAATFAFDPALMDLDHIEFLYGPQGTLYGAGSMGGLIKYVTIKPDTSGFSGSAGADISHTQNAGMNYSEHATLNLPLVKDVAALRVSVFDQHTAGLYRAVGETPAGGDDRNHTQGARVQLEVDPTDKLTLNLTAMAQRIDANGLSMADYSLTTGQPLSGGPYNRRLNHREPFGQDLDLYSFHAGYDFGWAQLDWVSSYQDFTNSSLQDYPDTFLSLLNQLGPALGVDNQLSSLYVDSHYDVHKTSQEIRLTSPKGDSFDWLGGLWFNRENVWEQYALEGANLPPPGTTSLLSQRVNSSFREYAGYGDVTWHISPLWDLTAGVRASGNSQNLSNFEMGPVAGRPGGFRENMTSDDITKMLSLSFRPDKMNSYYVRASTGYRPGGLQAPISSTLLGPDSNATDSFGSDALTSYEVGYKGSRLDGQLHIGIDAYDIEWHNMQLYTYTLGNTIIQNAGDARVDGLELQATYASGQWLFSLAAAYTDARTLQANPQIGIADGAPLPYSAKETATLAAKYKFSLIGNDAYAGANLRLSSERHAGFENDSSDPDFNLPGFGLLDLDAGLTLHSGTSIDFYLRNALDRRFPIGTLNDEAVNFLASVGGPMLVQLSTPRTIGMSFNVPF
jgi:iron complex outermembrane receptor protein